MYFSASRRPGWEAWRARYTRPKVPCRERRGKQAASAGAQALSSFSCKLHARCEASAPRSSQQKIRPKAARTHLADDPQHIVSLGQQQLHAAAAAAVFAARRCRPGRAAALVRQLLLGRRLLRRCLLRGMLLRGGPVVRAA